MSDLLLDVRDHLQAGDFLDGLLVQFWRWNDTPGAKTIVIRRAGTQGQSDYLVQRPDVRLLLVTAGGTSAEIREMEQLASNIAQYLRNYYRGYGVIHYQLLSNVIGPNFLENGRGVFELNLRCLVDENAQAASRKNRIIDRTANHEWPPQTEVTL